MKERPILMSGPMVRAILEGRKTETRRTMKKQPTIDPQTGDWLFTNSDRKQEVIPIEKWIEIQVKLHCPYGKPGDRFWVRETWNEFHGQFYYRADEEKPFGYSTPWRPSIFMPRAASRITLEIEEIRAERLQEISETDCIAEGIEKVQHQYTMWKIYSKEGGYTPHPKTSYWSLWNSINGPGAYEQNPWVWVIKFRVL